MASPATTPLPATTEPAKAEEPKAEATKPTEEAKKEEPPKEVKKEEPPKEAIKEEPPKEATEEKPSKDAPKAEEKTPEKKEAEKKEDAKSPEPEENGEAPGTPKGPNLREQFKAFSKFGDTKSDGKVLTLSQSDKWMKQAKVIDGKTITTTDTAITFKKFKQMKIGYPDYEKYLQELAKSKKQDLKAIKDKMRSCGTPGTRGTTSVVKGGAFDRLTDTQKYTGSSKQRFDAEGKGKGVAGRKDLDDKSGYVSGYKNKNTYSKTH